MARRGYPTEFRRRVIALVEGGKKVAEVSREFGISEQTVYVWRRQARIDAGLEADRDDVPDGRLEDCYASTRWYKRSIPPRRFEHGWRESKTAMAATRICQG